MKKKFGKEYILPEKKANMTKKKQIQMAKHRLASGLTGDEYKKAYREYMDLLYGNV